jgi:hypothetical protein
VPLLTSGPASPYWGIQVFSVTYNGKALGGGKLQAIVDTGTTLILVPTPVYNAFLKKTGGTTDSSSGLARFSTKPTGNVGFAIGELGVPELSLRPKQYLIPEDQ